jgi:hypothetical protein
MTRLFIALTLLMMSFLSALDSVEWLHRLTARMGMYRWVPELVLALAAVAVFVRMSNIHRRLLFPRRGLRLLAAGIAVYGLGVGAASGALVSAVALVPVENGSMWARVPDVVASLYPQPVFVAAQLLMVVGAFRALANLVSPGEFEADY